MYSTSFPGIIITTVCGGVFLHVNYLLKCLKKLSKQLCNSIVLRCEL